MSAADDGATDDLRALANAPLRRQAAALERIIRTDPDLMAILVLIRDLRLPDGWLLAGCLYQTVWNVMENRPRGHGVKDYDIGYFDGSDLSYEAEDAEIARVVARAPSGLDLELRNRNAARACGPSPSSGGDCDQAGTRTEARRPPSGESASAMSPPWPRAMSRAMARPRPVPPSS